MKIGNTPLMEALTILGTGEIEYIETIVLCQRSGLTYTADRVAVVDRNTIHARNSYSSLMMPAEELVCIEVMWKIRPTGVVDIPTAIAHEKKEAAK
jgi:hypothetical protein